MHRAAIIVAAGRATRMGEDKVWLELDGLPVIGYSLRTFASCPSVERLVLVVRADMLDRGRHITGKLGIDAVVCVGGGRRQDSVMRGLDASGNAELVAIHDGARPLITRPLIEACYDAAEQDGAAIAAVPVGDTIKRVASDRFVSGTVDRAGLWAAQTPQVFRTSLVRDAYERVGEEVTDDAAAVEMLGHRVRVVPGDPGNLKLTTPEDLALVKALLAQRA